MTQQGPAPPSPGDDPVWPSGVSSPLPPEWPDPPERRPPDPGPPPPPSPSPPGPPRRPGRRPLLVAAAVVAVLALTGGAISTWGDGRRQGGSGTPGPASSRATQGTSAPQRPSGAAGVRAVQSEVERLRDLRFERPVPVTVESPAKVAAQLLRELDRETDRADLQRQARALVLLGELPQGTDLYAMLRSIQAESVLGFYVPGKPPAKGRLYVRSGRGLDPYARIVLSHELTHAVTDQHYDLTLADRLAASNAADRGTAYSGLVEGDATVTMQLYHDRVLSPGEQLDADRVGAAQRTPRMDAAPPAVRESLIFPYAAGVAFVQALYQRGGWDAVNRAYRDPPASTEQLLHPERYLDRRDAPQRVRVPDLRGALGAGWRQGTRVEWGEFDTRLLLEGEFPVATAERVATGWDGGELRTFEQGNRTAMVLRTVWDSPGEASETCTAMSRWATARFGAPAAANRWSGTLQQGALACQGTQVAWLSAPDRPSLDRLVRGLGPA
jgi:hypothetical protein